MKTFAALVIGVGSALIASAIYKPLNLSIGEFCMLFIGLDILVVGAINLAKED
jgi:hypothetical protein